MAFFSNEDLAKLDGDRGPQKGGGGASNWARFTHDKNTGKPMKHKVRLLPLSAKDPYPFFYKKSHYFYGEKYLSGTCPNVAGEYCLACDIFFTLCNTPEMLSDDNKALRKSLNNLGPDQRAFANVWDYALAEELEEKAKEDDSIEVNAVKCFSIPYGAHKKIKETFDDQRDDYGVIITDPEDGRDLVMKYKKLGTNSMLEAPPTVSPKATPVPEGWQGWLFDLDKMSSQRDFAAEEHRGEFEEAGVEQLGDHYEEIMALYEGAKK